MCAVSMIMDHQAAVWQGRIDRQWPYGVPVDPFERLRSQPAVTRDELDEFRQLLDRAREYDRKNNEPDCELESKRTALKELARKMGLGELTFV